MFSNSLKIFENNLSPRNPFQVKQGRIVFHCQISSFTSQNSKNHPKTNVNFDSSPLTSDKWNVSKSMGTPMAFNTSCVASISSGPTPSPGMRVHEIRPSEFTGNILLWDELTWRPRWFNAGPTGWAASRKPCRNNPVTVEDIFVFELYQSHSTLSVPIVPSADALFPVPQQEANERLSRYDVGSAWELC